MKLRRFSSQFTETAAGGAFELEVWIRNAGIQIQNISIALGFVGPGKSGNCLLPIPLSDHSKDVASTFLRGTTASFLLSTANKDTSPFLGVLRDFAEQRPVINVYISSFLACSFPVCSRWDGFRKIWNRLSFRLSFNRRVGDGRGDNREREWIAGEMWDLKTLCAGAWTLLFKATSKDSPEQRQFHGPAEQIVDNACRRLQWLANRPDPNTWPDPDDVTDG